MTFDDLKISTKVALPAVILTVVALSITGVGAWQAKTAEAATKILVEQRAPAELESSRFNRRITAIGYAAYRTVSNDGASPEAQSASAEIDKAYKEAKENLEKVKAADPDSAKMVAGFRTRLDGIYSSGRQGADLGLQNAGEAAKMVMAVIDPDIASLSKDVSHYTNTHNDATRAMVAKAAKESAAGTLMSIAFGLIASAAAMVFALWIGRSKISAPLSNLSKTMETLAQGSVDVDVVGAQRKDEVGAMARSVQVFKDNAVALRTSEAAQLRATAETEAERRRNQETAEAAAREQAFVMENLAMGLNKLAEGDLTYRVDQEFPEAYKRLQSDFNESISQMEEAMRTIVHAASSTRRLGRDRLAPPTTCRAAASSRPPAWKKPPPPWTRSPPRCRRTAVGRRRSLARRRLHPRRRRTLQRCRPQRRRRHEPDREVVAVDQPDHRRHRRDRLPDQPAGPERRRRSGSRR